MSEEKGTLKELTAMTPVVAFVPTNKSGQMFQLSLEDLVKLGMVKDSSITNK